MNKPLRYALASCALLTLAAAVVYTYDQIRVRRFIADAESAGIDVWIGSPLGRWLGRTKTDPFAVTWHDHVVPMAEAVSRDVYGLHFTRGDIDPELWQRMGVLRRIHMIDLTGSRDLQPHHLADLRNFPSLVDLDLSETNVDDENLQSLDPLPSLKRLYLFDTQITVEGVAAYQANPNAARILPSELETNYD